jgi:hypothetical protein
MTTAAAKITAAAMMVVESPEAPACTVLVCTEVVIRVEVEVDTAVLVEVETAVVVETDVEVDRDVAPVEVEEEEEEEEDDDVLLPTASRPYSCWYITTAAMSFASAADQLPSLAPGKVNC